MMIVKYNFGKKVISPIKLSPEMEIIKYDDNTK